MITIGTIVQTTTAILRAAVGAAAVDWYCAALEAAPGRPCVDMSIRWRTTWIGCVSRPGV